MELIKNFNFKPEKYNKEEIVYFSKKTGLIDLFSKIDDLYTYLVGVEVGLDSNARKNRRGHIFETIVGQCIKNNIKNLKEYHLEKKLLYLLLEIKDRIMLFIKIITQESLLNVISIILLVVNRLKQQMHM